MKEGGILLNIESRHKIIRTETALDYINYLRDYCENKGLDLMSEFKQLLLNKIVIARYSNKHYKISKIALDMNPLSEFDYLN